jgi:hypothetical protein
VRVQAARAYDRLARRLDLPPIDRADDP